VVVVDYVNAVEVEKRGRRQIVSFVAVLLQVVRQLKEAIDPLFFRARRVFDVGVARYVPGLGSDEKGVPADQG
jgi:hypothetical protein